MWGMDSVMQWLTPAVVLAVGAWLRADFNGRMDRMDKRLDVIDKRLDGVAAQVGDLRERMAKLEGAVEGFMAGWRGRDRDAA